MRSLKRSAIEVKKGANGAAVAERVFSSKEIADALGVSKMTVLRCVEDGRLPRPGFFLMQQDFRVWLWDADEFALALERYRRSKTKAHGLRIRNPHN